jgi:hypothetical protein
MKMNHVRFSASLKLFLGVLLAGCFLATAAHAQSPYPSFKGTFELTNKVNWGNAVLRPGAYSLAFDRLYSDPKVGNITICDAHTGKIVVQAFSRMDINTATGDSQLLITVSGNQRAVYSLQLAGLGEVFHQAHPFAASEREAEEARNTEVIPVAVAQK